MADERFDGLFMSAIQQAQGIENFYDSMFSFMRRKTDFFSNEDSSFNTVKTNFEKHQKLYKEDTKRQELIKKKQDEEKAKVLAAQAAKAKPVVNTDGATVEEVDDEEAKKIELKSIFEKQVEAKKKKEENKDKKKEKDAEGSDKEENVFQKPNAGNGGQTEKYIWHQTL